MFFWFFGHEACGILAPRLGIEPAPPALEGEILSTGPPWKSHGVSSLIFLFYGRGNWGLMRLLVVPKITQLGFVLRWFWPQNLNSWPPRLLPPLFVTALRWDLDLCVSFIHYASVLLCAFSSFLFVNPPCILAGLLMRWITCFLSYLKRKVEQVEGSDIRFRSSQ